ncbi:MAG TPA: NADH:flavin oxidoreductase [Dissulfurispiraceae bacterium]|nr:NADH:flavin oxidoreductase [Dissulfurispiraceae bacterium]
MRSLFEPVTLNGMALANRFIRSATWEGLADEEGFATDNLKSMLVDLALGEVGLIMSSFTFISREGQSNAGQLAIYDDRFIPALQNITEAIHGVGGKVALQLVHGGCLANSEFTGVQPMGPNDCAENGVQTARAMTKTDIEHIILSYIDASVRARKAGFDAVQIHSAHGYLLSQFLSPALNERKDEYGGGLINRASLLLQVVEGVRTAVGSDYPLFVKLNSEDFMEGGLTKEDAIGVALLLQESSVDAIELSGGSRSARATYMAARKGTPKTVKEEVYYQEAAKLYKQKISIPLMLVGGIRSYKIAEELIQNNRADFISFCRPLIREPHLIKRWREGDRRKAECISCNGCYGPAREGKGVACVINKRSPR